MNLLIEKIKTQKDLYDHHLYQVQKAKSIEYKILQTDKLYAVESLVKELERQLHDFQIKYDSLQKCFD